MKQLTEPDRSATAKSYMWLYRTGRDVPTIVLYDYQTTRAGKHPKAFLKVFSGYLHVDGYAEYHDLPKVALVGCWAHVRRYWLKADSKNGQIGVDYCDQLYRLEREFSEFHL